MTRKKWNRLRRTRPELFSILPPWEKMKPHELEIMRPVSKSEAITAMTTWFLTHNPADLWGFGYPLAYHFNPRAHP